MLVLPTAAPVLLAAAADDAAPAVSDTRLIVAAVVGIAVIVALIVWVKLHPFLALMLGAGVLAVAAGLPYVDAFTSFTKGLGETVAGVGILIALG
ncbi:MAG TPA: gluconate transporter, partial [Cellulomonas sp.]|nr:gluconate transporter [Cellulomonas sp.]